MRKRGGGKDSDRGFFFTWRGGGFESRLCLRFGGEGGEEKNFFLGPRIFLQGGGGGEGGPGKKDPMAKQLFFPFPAGFTVPTATSRLGQPTNGGNAGRVGSGEKKKPLGRRVFFSGVGRGEGKVKKGMHGTWIATGERVLSQTQIPWSASSKRRGGGRGVDRAISQPTQ